MEWRLHDGDCLTIMRNMNNESFDAIITDPPYGIDYQSSWRTDKEKRHPKINNDDRPFIWWLHDAYRVTKEGGVLICFCRWDTQETFKNAIELSGFEIKSQVIWDRDIHGMGDLKSSFAPRHDVIWFAIKGSFEFPGKRPSSVIKCQRLDGLSLTHPNEKPVGLMQCLIEYTTKKGDIVLDPFAGSGATMVAAIKSERKCVGIEINKQYCEIIRKRLSEPQIISLFAV